MGILPIRTRMSPIAGKTIVVECLRNILSKWTRQLEKIRHRSSADTVAPQTWNISAITAPLAKRTGRAAGRLMTPRWIPTMGRAMSPFLRPRFAFVVETDATMPTLFLRYQQQQLLRGLQAKQLSLCSCFSHLSSFYNWKINIFLKK